MLRSTTASVLTVVPATLSFCPALRTFPQPHLTARAEVGRAAADDDAHDRAAAAQALLPLSRVDEELVLHRPLLAPRVAVVVDRGAAGVDPRLQRRHDGVPERLPVLRLHRARRGQRVQLGPEERLVGVDVADPGDAGLVEQERLQRRLSARRHLSQRLRGELGRERLDAQLREPLLQPRVLDQEGLAEAARIGEPELAPVVKDEAGPQVPGLGRALALVQTPPLGGIEYLLALAED